MCPLAACVLTPPPPSTYLAALPCSLLAVDAEIWSQAGGESYCENCEFPSLLGKRWLQVLSKPGGRGPQQ